MGTRGLMGFASGDTLKAAYNHFDSYPDYLGRVVFSWALAADLDEAKLKFATLEIVDESDNPTDEQIARLAKAGLGPAGVSTGADFYAWLRDLQGDPQATLDAGFITDSVGFGMDPLFCEWAYVVDLDKRVVEVYSGDGGGEDERWPGGIKLVLTAPLDGSVTVQKFIEQADAAGRD